MMITDRDAQDKGRVADAADQGGGGIITTLPSFHSSCEMYVCVSCVSRGSLRGGGVIPRQSFFFIYLISLPMGILKIEGKR